MGYQVLAFCHIRLNKGDLNEDLKRKIKKMVDDVHGFQKEFEESWISFTLSGNKGVDYEVLDKIKKLLLSNELQFAITAGEYMEVDGGYYYDSEDDKNDRS